MSTHEPELWEHASFLIGPCDRCAREVLTCRDLQGDDLIDRCMHCEAMLSEETLSWATPQEVVALGYFIDGFVEQKEGESGGCKGGACGVRQPEKSDVATR